MCVGAVVVWPLCLAEYGCRLQVLWVVEDTRRCDVIARPNVHNALLLWRKKWKTWKTSVTGDCPAERQAYRSPYLSYLYKHPLLSSTTLYESRDADGLPSLVSTTHPSSF